MADREESEKLDRILAALLWYGTWAASALIAAGMGLGGLQRVSGSLPGVGYTIVKTGVALLIALPAARVLMLFGIFLHRRDLIYASFAAGVLAILSAGIVTGVYS